MLKKVPIIMLSLFLSLPLAGEEAKDNAVLTNEPDTLIPITAPYIVKVRKIKEALEFINGKKEYLNFNKMFPELGKWIQLVKEKAGIDLLDQRSLKEAGIDINEALYSTSIGTDESKDQAVIFIPVTDKKNFALSAVKLLKKISKDSGTDINPAIINHKGTKVFQATPDIFFAVVYQYFVLAHTIDSLYSIIDAMPKEGENSLAKDPFYKSFKNKPEINSQSHMISVFLKKGLFNAGTGLQENIQYNDEQQNSDYNYINYISLFIGNKGDEIAISGNLSVNKEDPAGNFILQAITTGLLEKALFTENPTGYHFISLDIEKIKNYLDQAPDKENTFYRQYIKTYNPTLIKDTVLPCSKSFINIIFTKSKNAGQMDNMVLYIPMKECGQIESTLKKIKDELKKRYNADGTFGEEKINGSNSFWFKDENGNKYNILEFKGNLYAGNNIDSIKNTLSAGSKNFSDIKKDFIKTLDKNIFLFSYTKFDDESFFKAVLMMLAFNQNPGLYHFISKMESINLTGKKIESDINFDVKIKMQH